MIRTYWVACFPQSSAEDLFFGKASPSFIGATPNLEKAFKFVDEQEVLRVIVDHNLEHCEPKKVSEGVETVYDAAGVDEVPA